MLQIGDIVRIIQGNLECIRAECEMLESILPGHHRTDWVRAVRKRIIDAGALLTETEAKCVGEVALAGDMQIDPINQWTEQVKETARQLPDNQIMHVQAVYMEVLRREAFKMLVNNAGLQEVVISEEFKKLRAEVRYLTTKTKSL